MPKPLRSAKLATVAIALIALAACELLVGYDCTVIGCAPALTVTLDPPPGSEYSVALIVGGDTTTRVYECPGVGGCSGAFAFYGVSAQTVTVVVRAGGDEFRRDVQPTYTTSRPNGPRCDPVCRQGAVTVVLPVAMGTAGTR